MTTQAAERLEEATQPVLEVISERIGGLPVVFVPEGSLQEAFGCSLAGADDLERARTALHAEGAGSGRPVLVGADDWARVFPVGEEDRSLGSVVVVGRLMESLVPATERIVGLLGAMLAARGILASLREEGREVAAGRQRLAERVDLLEELRRFAADLRDVVVDTSPSERLRLVVERLARLAGGPVVLQNAALAILAESGGGAETQALAPSRHQSVRDVLGPLGAAADAVELRAGNASRRRLALPVRARGELVGVLVAAVDADRDELVRPALQVTAGWIAFEHVLSAEAEDDRGYDRDGLLFDLATGTAPGRLPERARRLGFDLSASYVPCVFTPSPVGAEAAGHLRRIVEDALRAASPSARDALVGVLDEAVAAVIPENAPAGPAAICEAVVGAARERSLAVRAGIGSPCRAAGDYETGLRQARWVTDVLGIVSPDAGWAAFSDLGVYALLFDRHRAGELDEFVARWLGPLVAYDEAHHTDLVTTLRSVLDTGGVMTEAAKRLYIHISTLKYRVGRIEDLLGVELRNAELAFNLHLACKILAVREGLAPPA